MSNTYGATQARPEDNLTDYHNISFIIKRALARIRTATPVKVVSCSNNGGVSAIGTVVVQPLVNMTDGQGNSQSHGKINNVPYFRMMGGQSGALICDPVAGDIGLLVVSDRDISGVQSSAAAANPGSYRRFDLADGFYIGGFITKQTPNCYIQFDGKGNMTIADNNNNKIQMTSSGLSVTDGNNNTFQLGSSGITLTPAANVIINGNLQLSGSIEAIGGGTYTNDIATTGNFTAGSIDLKNHTHSDPQGGSTGPPTG